MMHWQRVMHVGRRGAVPERLWHIMETGQLVGCQSAIHRPAAWWNALQGVTPKTMAPERLTAQLK